MSAVLTVLIVFDSMIVDMKSNINLKPISTDISAVVISKFYFTVPKIIRLNATHFY